MTYPVAALYVDPNGPYPQLATFWYDEKKDATTYTGPLPVVAHPPCGPWGRLYRRAKKDRADLAVIAVEQVRRYGGVLEHPADSKLWGYCDLPHPFSLFPDAFGGRTYCIAQGDFGHPAPKFTWLYAVGLGPSPFLQPFGNQKGRVARQHSGVRHITPYQLARQLCHWASQPELAIQ